MVYYLGRNSDGMSRVNDGSLLVQLTNSMLFRGKENNSELSFYICVIFYIITSWTSL